MQSLGHVHLDVLKIDIEGWEWSVFDGLRDEGRWPFDQLLIELHPEKGSQVIDFFEPLIRAGFRIFAKEFVLLGLKFNNNRLFEYSLIRHEESSGVVH